MQLGEFVVHLSFVLNLSQNISKYTDIAVHLRILVVCDGDENNKES